MNTKPNTKEEAEIKGEAPAASGQCGAPPEPDEGCMDKASNECVGMEREAPDTGKPSGPNAGDAAPPEGMGADGGPAPGPELMKGGEAPGGSPGQEEIGPQREGFHTVPGAGAQYTGPFPGVNPYLEHPANDPGLYGQPAYGPQQSGPMPGPDPRFGHPAYGPYPGGPQAWPHPGPGHHQGCAFHHGDMLYGQPPHVPYAGDPGMPGFGYSAAPHQQDHGVPQNGRFADVVGKALQGDASPQDLIGGLLNLNFQDDQFWKGVVVGSVASLLLNSDTVRQALAGALGGALGKPPEKRRSEDPAGDPPASDTEPTE